MYTFNSRVRYSELNQKGALSVPSIINYFQDSSTFQSEDLGVGMDYLEKNKKVWMLTNWHVVIEKQLYLGQDIQISTCPYDFDKLFGYRNFAITDKSGTCVKGDSKWILFDLTKGRPTRLSEEDVKAHVLEKPFDLNKSTKKSTVSKDSVEKESFEVKYHHLDTNGHVNNAKYIEMAMDFISNKRGVQEFYVEYKTQALLGDVIIPYIEEIEDGVVVSLLGKDKKTIYVIVEFVYSKKECL